MFHVTFILRSHVWRQLGSVNEQATVLRSARPLSSVQNKGNILGCGSHNTKETLEPCLAVTLSGRGAIFQLGLGPSAGKGEAIDYILLLVAKK